MNVFDIIFIALFIYALVQGYRQGFVVQLSELAALVLGVYLAYRFSYLLATWVTGLGVGATAVTVVSFLLTFIAVIIIAKVVGTIVARVLHIVMLGWLDTLLGMLFAFIKMAFVISVILLLINTVDKELGIMPQKSVAKSKMYHPIAQVAPKVLPILKFDQIKAKVKKIEQDINTKIDQIKK